MSRVRHHVAIGTEGGDVELSRRDKTLTLVGIVMALFLGALDQTIVATALPSMVDDLGGVSRYAWVVTAYVLASTVLVPVYGKLADMLSRRRIELFAVVTFLIGSFLCGAAGQFGTLPLLGDGMTQLIVFRALQGIGGAGLFAMAFIVISDLYPPRERGKYLGLIGAVFAIASVLGPWLGGLLTDHAGGIVPGVAGWRWVFYVNLPVGAVALWFIVTRMPPLRPRSTGQRLDLVSVALLILTLVPLVLGLQFDRTIYPWGGAVTVGTLSAAAVFGLAFVLRSLTSANPVLDLRLFRNRVFAVANGAGFFLGATFLSLLVFVPLYLVNVLGVSATEAGVALIPLSLGVSVGAIGAGQLASRLGRYKPIMLVAIAVLLVAAVLMTTLDADSPYGRVVWIMVVAGLGIGPGFPLYTVAIQNAVEGHLVGQATSAAQFFRLIGGAVGTALMGAVLATTLAAAFAQLPDASALPEGALDPSRFAGEVAGDAGEDLARALESELGAEGLALAADLSEALRNAFATAVSRVFGVLLWLVIAAASLTLWLPGLELRGAAPARR
ncbi:MAG: DHA2 family efflux MFS transporter permease subunit [Trueperaceae bacterium]|nr:MAG: DHA2 family efflux MFS transporter permease subunit [Trueperaceae bacterium]